MPASRLNRVALTKALGSLAGLIQGDPLMTDRWLWLRQRLPETANGEMLLDVGCGSGAFTICASERGYSALGLTWDESDTAIATERAALCRADKAGFTICDVRHLDEKAELIGRFDVIICCENIEHILDDRRLAKAMSACLKPGGRLLLTTPNYHYRAIEKGDLGPFRKVEDGWHVRRGYSEAQLRDLFAETGILVEKISYCGGFFSQRLTGILRMFSGKSYVFGWAATLIFRPVAPFINWMVEKTVGYPPYSICLEGYKARWSMEG